MKFLQMKHMRVFNLQRFKKLHTLLKINDTTQKF